MSRLKFIKKRPGDVLLKKANRQWYIFKGILIALVVLSLASLTINNRLNETQDDFTKDQGGNLTTVEPSKKAYEDETTSSDYPRKNSLSGRGSTMLSEFLVLYPSCTTILITLGMEILGQALDDPLSKSPTIVLFVLCFLLSAVAFTVSLLSALRTLQITMIMFAVFIMLFALLNIIDFVLLLYS